MRLFIDTKSAQTTHGNNLSVNTLNTFYGGASIAPASGSAASSIPNTLPPFLPSTTADTMLNLSSANLTSSSYSTASPLATARPSDRRPVGDLRVGQEHFEFPHSPASSSVVLSPSAQQLPSTSPHLKPLDFSSLTPITVKANDVHYLDQPSSDHHDTHSMFDLNISTTITSSARLTPQQTLAPTTPRSFEKLSPTGPGVGKPLAMRQGSLPDQLPPSRPGSRRPSRAAGLSPNTEEFDADAAEHALAQYARRTRSTTNLHPEDELPLKALVTNKHQISDDEKKGNAPASKPGSLGDIGVRHLQNIATTGQFYSSPTSSPTTTMLPELRPLRLSALKGSEDVYQELSITLNHLDEYLDAVDHALSVIKL